MKGVYVITIAFLAPWAVSALDIPTVCPFPERFPENTTTNLPHETDCTKFYKCFLGRGILQDCPLMTKGDSYTRLHYNRRLQVCDWPWTAGCESCPRKDHQGNLPPYPSYIGHEINNCDQFYRCSVDGHPSAQYCTPGTCFSRTCQRCVRNRQDGSCDGSSTPWPIPPRSCEINDKKPHECNCAQYYQCNNSEDWIVKSCTGGLHFSPSYKSCMEPDRAGCTLLP
ncbi:hypothetical protein P5V15_006622 [Pogonomyrmex californicus]